VYLLNLGLYHAWSFLERLREPTQDVGAYAADDSHESPDGKAPGPEPDTSTDDEVNYIFDSESAEDGAESQTKKYDFDAEDVALLKHLCTRSDSPEDYRFHRGLRGCNQALARNFNAEMRRRRGSFQAREVAQIANRINRPDFKQFLADAGVPSLRAASRRWTPAEEALLTNALLAQAAQTPGELHVVGDAVHMTATFERLLVLAAQGRGVQRPFREILSKAKQIGKRLLGRLLSRRN
jgi:hypothetical protein